MKTVHTALTVPLIWCLENNMKYKREYTVSKALKYIRGFGKPKDFMFATGCDERDIRDRAETLGHENLTEQQIDDIIGHMENGDIFESGINYIMDSAIEWVMEE